MVQNPVSTREGTKRGILASPRLILFVRGSVYLQLVCESFEIDFCDELGNTF
jgi:hypothetical protein